MGITLMHYTNPVGSEPVPIRVDRKTILGAMREAARRLKWDAWEIRQNRAVNRESFGRYYLHNPNTGECLTL